jgi:hypothetical protein
VNVTLADAGDDGLLAAADVDLGTQTTVGGGSYAFADLSAGRYRVGGIGAAVPVGFTLSSLTDQRDTDLGAAEALSAVSFGYRRTCSGWFSSTI